MGKFARKNQKELRNEAKRSARPARTKSSHVVDPDSVNDVDNESPDFMYGEADQHHRKRQKILERGFEEADDDDEMGSEEEVMPVGGDTTDEESEDDDDDSGEEGDDLPNRSAWGSKRANFYHTDFVDKDHGRFQGSDAEEAEEEEREAKELQAKLTRELTDDDFGLAEAMESLPATVASAQTDTGIFGDVEKMSGDVSKLSDFEKMERIKLESPELLDLIADCRGKLTELVDVIQPLLAAISASPTPLLTDRAELYVRTKYQLILGYCQNVSFYLSLKAKRMSVENHPVTRRLVDFRRFLLKLAPLDAIYSRPITAAVAVLNEGGDLQRLLPSTNKASKNKKVTFGHMVKSSDGSETGAKSDSLSRRVKEKPSTKKVKPSTDSDEEDEEDGGQDDSTPQGKRKLTYQIEKNKGTTPYRKKEYRNPRVKHRMKYRKAQISRKGQVQIYRPELKKYGGEMTGIRAGVVRSVKFK